MTTSRIHNTVSCAILLTFLWLAPTPGLPATGREASRPNILFILADDLGWADVGWHGKDINTPNLDKLAASGARLEQFYVLPVCSPTRGALLTGRYPMRYGLQTGVVRPWADYGLPLEERTLPQALKAAGYRTAICGKWHLGAHDPAYLPTRRGFDHQYGHYCGAIDYFAHTRDGGFDWHRDDRVCRDEGYSTFLLAEEAVRLIRGPLKSSPFFLYVPFNAVHAPHQVPERYKVPYAHLREPRRTYAAMVSAMDEAIGRIIGALDEVKLKQNTLVIFSSDNGGPNPGRVSSNGQLRAGKGTLYEGGVRACAFATWPSRIQPGRVINDPIHVVDWFPTLLSLAGAPLAQALPLDGRDVWPLIAEGKPLRRDEILLNTEAARGAIRVGDWKLVLGGGRASVEIEEQGEDPEAAAGGTPKNRVGAARTELFNLQSDPSEADDLAKKQPGKVKELRDRYDAYARQAQPPKNKPMKAGFKAPQVWGQPE